MYFHNVVIVFPSKLEHLNFKLNSNSFTKDTIFDIWLKLVKWFWKRRFLNVVNIFLQCRSYLPFERGIIIHLSKLDSPPSMLLTKFGWDGLITSGEVENVKKKITDRQKTNAFSSGQLKPVMISVHMFVTCTACLVFYHRMTHWSY